ncbi:MAG: TrmH family RNA methyltransferase [Candidatus Pacebacteria bacterium]|nr:TrmH family RNA methyltransferase [Candidatus Paceibacterota bacterium]MCF7857658.1 TrmH family RNA methyltransferase [Candidatus Paceibacterota bacterium]
MNTYVILHNIRSAHNVGSIFRTCDGSGVSKIYLTGYTPAPVDRFGRESKEILKTSLGATKTVSYEVVNDAISLIKQLRQEEVSIIAVEQTSKATNYETLIPQGNKAFIFGNEITGIEEDVLECCDQHISIPMRGTKESLNVSVCAGVILFHFA